MKAGLVLLWLSGLVAAQQVTPLQMPPGVRVRDVAYADVDGDGLRDLVVSTTEPERALRIYLQQAGKVAFAPDPAFLLKPVWKDVVGFAIGDVHPDPGAEIVLFTAKAVWVWRPRAAEKDRAKKLATCSFLWQLPDPGALGVWEPGVRDLNGDGRVDLMLPEPDGYRILLQQPAGVFDHPQRLVVPAGPDASLSPPLSLKSRSRKLRTRLELRFSLNSSESAAALGLSGPLLEISDSVPAPQFRDWDADGDLDLIVRTERWLFVWIQDHKGRFGSRPRVSLEIPVTEDRSRRLEVSYSAHVLDLDRDRRVDCIIFSGDQRSKKVRTQVQIFRQAGKRTLFSADGLPDQLLVLAGFAGMPFLDDVDGDGYPDLLVGAVRPDLLDGLRGSSAQIDAELYLFRNRRGSFGRHPDLTFRTSIEAKGLRLSRRSIMARFFADVTGDGLRDLILRDQQKRIRVLMTRRTRGGLTLFPTPLWELSISDRAEVRLYQRDVLILEKTQVVHVRFP